MEKSLKFSNENNDINIDNLNTNILLINNLKTSINDILGIFPFLWFCDLFTTICIRLTQTVINKDYEMVYVLWNIIENAMIVFINLIYLLAINYFQTHRPTVNELVSSNHHMLSAMSSRELLLKVIMNQNFNNYCRSKYMAFNVFAIDLKFLFSFTGSVITFTVMLMQLCSSN